MRSFDRTTKHPPERKDTGSHVSGGRHSEIAPDRFLLPKTSCACGGGCPSCRESAGDLRMSAPNDLVEIEADRVADSVMRGNGAGRAPHTAGGPAIHAKHDTAVSGATGVPEEVSRQINSSRGNGRSLEASTQTLMESRFATDLSPVRVHTGGEAARLSQDLSAKAFTIGNDIFFGEGHYRPESDAGKHLIAHELAHVQQGGHVVRRCADKKNEAVYDAKITEIKALEKYTGLDPDPKKRADTIMTEGRDKADCLYYADKLKDLFTTPEKGNAEVAEKQRKRTEEAVKAEEKRLTTEEAKKTLSDEELATADPEPEPPVEPGKEPPPPRKGARNWTTYPTRFGNGKYKVDATDLANIYVKVKINLVPKGEGTWDDVKKIKSLEDAIEKHASRKGFVLNLEFVNPANDSAFVKDEETAEIGANPKWPTATSWGGNARTNAHELYHVLNFKLDRYDYIEKHAKNPDMIIPERLHWFLEQMHKPEGFDNPASLMGSGQYPIEEDICQIAQLDIATCVKAREKLFPPPLKFRTLARFLPSIGYAQIGGEHGLFTGVGYDLGIPLTHEADWRLFVGAHGTLLKQLEGDKRLAFLVGARIGIEKTWSTPKTSGPVFGGFAEGGLAFVQDKESATASSEFLTGRYGYGGVNLGYRVPAMDLTFDAEFGGGITSQLGLHDPRTFVRDPEMVPFVTAGIRATFMFGGP